MTQTLKTRDLSDSELVKQSLAGNRDGFGVIVARYQSMVCSIAYSATGSLSQSEDLAQETFVTAWKQLAALRDPEKLRSWLCRITRNLTYDALLRQGREPIHKAEPMEEAEETCALAPLPSDDTIRREEETILWRSLERIPERFREPLVLYYREHQSIKNVAAALDLSEDAVKQRLSRGRKLLHEQVLAFVEGALERTNPGQAFTMGVLAALPAVSFSSKAVAAGVASKGGTAAKAVAASGLSLAILAAALGFLGNYFGYRAGMEGAQSDYERDYINRFYRKLVAGILGFWAAYGLLMILAKQIIVDRHLAYSCMIGGLVLPFTFVLIASGIFWLRAPRKFRVHLATKGVSAQPAGPAWEYRSKLGLFGLPFIHVRARGGLTTPTKPVKAWIASGDCAVGLLFAAGNLAIAPVSMGALAIGVFSFGGGAAGLISLGGFSLGMWSFGVLALGWQTYGACAMAWIAADGGIAIAHHFAMGGIASALQANTDAARSYFGQTPFFHRPRRFLLRLACLNLLWVIPMLVRWRVVAGGRRKPELSH